ncbi:MAG TPA: oxidoreductase [Mycobacterium sp.]|nr:oxidoreductase [Mycobacterium sp.]
MGRERVHAVVIGASIAGLCAARVLSDFYERVTVIERDPLPTSSANRSAVPQGRHLHLLAARGADEFATLFPGLLEDMVAAGVPILEDQPRSLHFAAAGHVLGIPTDPDLWGQPFTTYIPSRPHLEWQIRRRTAGIDNVTITAGSVSAPQYDAAAERVSGVHVDPVDRGDTGFLATDLVVDATGRGTRLPVWLSQWGFQRPPEATVDVGITYATHDVDIPEGLLEEKMVIAGASRNTSQGLGMLQYEHGGWVVTTFGIARAPAPRSFADMCELADAITPPHVAAALRKGQPVGELANHSYPTSRWRRYDKLKRFPAGIVPLGDAVASFNPTYGQGMTMTAIQAANLRRVLESGTGDLAGEFNRATAKTTFPVWTMNAVGDHTLQQARGAAPRWYKPVGELFDQFLGAAESDPVLAEWFLRRLSLLDSLYMVPPARIVGRTVRHNLRCWWAEKRGSTTQFPIPA